MGDDLVHAANGRATNGNIWPQLRHYAYNYRETVLPGLHLTTSYSLENQRRKEGGKDYARAVVV